MRVMLMCCLSIVSAAAIGDVVEVSPIDDLRTAIGSLSPGDELVLSGGEYDLDSRFNITVVGSQSLPIVIRGKTGERALISMNTGAQNILEVQDSRYLEIRDLVFTGGSHGIRLMSSDFITIEGCEIFETGDVAISANSGGTYEGLIIRRNHIHHTNGTGEGMYLGCNNDDCRVANSTIEWNYIHDTNRSTVEQGDGIELKEGSYGNTIRHNVIHDTNYPGIITYSTVGNGPRNVIEGNLIWNSNDNGIQSAADSVIRNNIVLGSPIALQSHQAGSPSNQEVVHNTVIADGSGIEVRDVSGPVLIANNAVYSRSGSAIRVISGDTAQVTVSGNVGTGGISGASSGYTEGNGIDSDFDAAHYGGSPPIDPFPAGGGALVDAGTSQYGATEDFNGTVRDSAPDAGAYEFVPGGNPGWILTEGFKSQNSAAPAPLPPTDFTAN